MGLLALFDFFDSIGSSTAQDSAGTPQNATFYGDATTDGAGTALFDGDGDYAVMAPDPAFDLAQGTIELSFTMNSSSPGNSPYGSSAAHTVFSSDAQGTAEGHLTIFVKTDGEIVVRHQTDGVHHYYSGGNAPIGTEVDVSYSFGPSGSVLFVNGISVDSGTQAHTMTGGTNPIVLGASGARSSTGTISNPEGFFDGSISRAAIYDDQTGSRSAPPCVVLGTIIATPTGPRAVETLRPGDEVITRDRGVVTILRIMRHGIRLPGLILRPKSRPIDIPPCTLGNHRALSVSRQHCLLMSLGGQDVLVRAGHLADFGFEEVHRADGPTPVVYFHLLLPNHDLIRAEGCWIETLRPDSPMVPQALRQPPATAAAGPCRPILSGREVREALRQDRLRPIDSLPLAS